MNDEFGLPEDLLDAADLVVEEPVIEEPGIEMAQLLPTGGDRVYLPIARDENGELVEVSIMQAALEAGLSIPANTQFWLEGVEIDPNSTILRPGMVVTSVGNVKGGGN